MEYPQLLVCHNIASFGSCKHRLQEFWLRDDEFSFRSVDMVGQFILGVGGVCAGEDTACGDDAEDEDWIVYVVEGVDADAVARLETGTVETGDKSADKGAGLI